MESIFIQAGRLDVIVHSARRPLRELLAFASRQNPKRGYLFVSKVLGKHWPACPGVMRGTYDELAALIEPGWPSYVVGMAETATGLGAGVADSLSRSQAEPVYYQHTTRHRLEPPLWFALDEAHSHAVDHLFYRPGDDCIHGIEQTRRLVLVDDEISTGRTLRLLAERLLPRLPRLREIVVTTLVSWLDRPCREPFARLPVPVRFVNLLQGVFRFTPNPAYRAPLPDQVDTTACALPSRVDLGRRGMLMPYAGPIPELLGQGPVTVVGDGEHLYLPFLAAETEHQRGRDVLFQSTTRSPIQPGDGIGSKLAFAIDERPVQHYIYNLASDPRSVAVLLENDALRSRHGLARRFASESEREIDHDAA
jgi:hypothetical protein